MSGVPNVTGAEPHRTCRSAGKRRWRRSNCLRPTLKSAPDQQKHLYPRAGFEPADRAYANRRGGLGLRAVEPVAGGRCGCVGWLVMSDAFTTPNLIGPPPAPGVGRDRCPASTRTRRSGPRRRTAHGPPLNLASAKAGVVLPAARQMSQSGMRATVN